MISSPNSLSKSKHQTDDLCQTIDTRWEKKSIWLCARKSETYIHSSQVSPVHGMSHSQEHDSSTNAPPFLHSFPPQSEDKKLERTALFCQRTASMVYLPQMTLHVNSDWRWLSTTESIVAVPRTIVARLPILVRMSQVVLISGTKSTKDSCTCLLPPRSFATKKTKKGQQQLKFMAQHFNKIHVVHKPERVVANIGGTMRAFSESASYSICHCGHFLQKKT